MPLLLLQLIILSLQIEGASGTLLFKTWTLTAQAPILAASSAVTGGIRRVWTGYVWTVGARAENERLRESVLLDQSLPYRTLGARVIARTPSFLSNVIYIDRGAKDGVKIDAPVL